MRAAILAGGAARRFGGEPKGLERVAGRRLLDRVVDVVRRWDDAPLLITSAPDAAAWSQALTVVADIRPGCGSLGGLLTALSTTKDATLLVGWDMPFLSTQLIAALIEPLEAGFDAVLPQSEGPLGLEPLCGVYRPSCLPAIERALAQEDNRMTSFHGEVRLSLMPLARVHQFGDPAVMFFNVNAPEDLSYANRVASRQTSETS